MSEINTECGVFGCVVKNTAQSLLDITITGLKSIQHRGHESFGIGFYDKKEKIINKKLGFVQEIFTSEQKNKYNPKVIIGHVRYSTSGKQKNISDETLIKYTQPLCLDQHDVMLAFNGNIPIMKKVYPDIDLDSKCIVKFLEVDSFTFIERLIHFQKMIPGVYCIAAIYNDNIYLMRDRYGIRPLCIGQNENGFCFSSESQTFDKIGFKFLREVNAGEIVKITATKIKTIFSYQPSSPQFCSFEYIYFLDPESTVDNLPVSNFRINSGICMAEKDTNRFDARNTIVCGCPQSGILPGVAYSHYLGLKYMQCISKNCNSGRTFILPDTKSRRDALRKKYNLLREGIEDKVLVIVDDSIVRGNTFYILIEQIWKLKPKEIHLRIVSPPVRHPCYFGIDIPDREELIINKYDINELTQYFNVNSIKYLEIDDIVKSAKNRTMCTSCFSGKYNEKILEW